MDPHGPQLDPDYRRARTDSQKSERSAAILLAARQEFDEHAFHGFTMRAVAERVHISKAALYGYHASKHAILATLASGMVASWASALDDAAETGGATDAFVARVVDSLRGRDTLVGLLEVLEPCVVPGLSETERAALRADLAASQALAGGAIERGLPGVAAGQGAPLARAVLALASLGDAAEPAVRALLRGARAP